jgi:hypothetical protein
MRDLKDRPGRFAYADPPYLGCGHRYPEKQEIDHAALIARLVEEFPDGWALSCHSPSLRILLALVPDVTRVMAWVKPFCSFKPGVGVAYAWEPLLVCGGRRRTRRQLTVRDWCAANITLRRPVIGAKPDAFCYWLFGVLGLRANDEFHDLFPGSGAVIRAWEQWRQQPEIPYALPGRRPRPGTLLPEEVLIEVGRAGR